MKTKLKRRERIVRVRAAERKISENRHAIAERKAAQLDAMADRIDRLEDEMFSVNDYSDGQALQNKAALQKMLDKARRDLSEPRHQSHVLCDQRADDRRHATMRSEGAIRYFDRSLKAFEAEQQLREDANRPYVRRAGWGSNHI